MTENLISLSYIGSDRRVGAIAVRVPSSGRDRRDSRNSLENMTLLGVLVKKTTAIGGCDRTVFPIS